tara:strand:+ start:1794 stop:2696 length:903 start_codon:yes stop_codon:yes gene_type:complete
MNIKSLFYLFLSVFLFSCGGREIKNNDWHKLVSLKTPIATSNPSGNYTVDYIFEYDSNSLEIKAEPAFSFTNTTLRLGLNNPDSIKFSVRILSHSKEEDYSVILTDIVSKYNGKLLAKDIILDRRALQAKDNWDIDFTENLYNPYFKYKIPIDAWLYWALLIGGIVFLLIVVFFILKRDNMPFGRQTFENGRFAFNDPQLAMVKLSDMEEFDLGKHLTGTVDVNLKLTHKKVTHKKKEIKVARLSFSDPNIRIKVIHFDVEEMASSGYQLFNNDDLIITLKIDNENKKFNLTYFNTKNRR